MLGPAIFFHLLFIPVLLLIISSSKDFLLSSMDCLSLQIVSKSFSLSFGFLEVQNLVPAHFYLIFIHFIVVSILFLNSSSFETTLNEIFLCSQLLCSKQHSPEQILDFYHYQTGTTNLEQLLLDLQIINDFDKKMKDFQEILDLSIRNSFGFKMFSGPTRKKIDDEIQMSVLLFKDQKVLARDYRFPSLKF